MRIFFEKDINLFASREKFSFKDFIILENFFCNS